MGEVSKINLKSIPTVKTLIKDIVNKAIEDLCYPNLVTMSVPCVTASQQLDEKGKVIKNPKKKIVKRAQTLIALESDDLEELQNFLKKKK